MTDATTILDLTLIRVRPLVDKTCLDKFECGERDLNQLAAKAEKWMKQRRHRVFAAHLQNFTRGLGFYALSFKIEDEQKLGRDQAQIFAKLGAPILYIEGLAVRRTYQNQGLGKLLLIDALKRAHHISQHVGVYGVGLRSLNERTTHFYEQHGFGAIETDQKHPMMVVPIWTLDDLFAPAEA